MRRWTMSLIVIAALAVVAASPASADSNRHCKWDSSSSVQVCVTLNYNVGYYPGTQTTAAASYNVRWTVYDGSVSISNATVRGGMNGWSTGGTYYYEKTQPWSVAGGYPSSGVVYTYVPWWAGIYILNNSQPAFWQSVRADATLHRGGSSWSFGSYVVCAPGSWSGLGCAN